MSTAKVYVIKHYSKDLPLAGPPAYTNYVIGGPAMLRQLLTLCTGVLAGSGTRVESMTSTDSLPLNTRDLLDVLDGGNALHIYSDKRTTFVRRVSSSGYVAWPDNRYEKED